MATILLTKIYNFLIARIFFERFFVAKVIKNAKKISKKGGNHTTFLPTI